MTPPAGAWRGNGAQVILQRHSRQSQPLDEEELEAFHKRVGAPKIHVFFREIETCVFWIAYLNAQQSTDTQVPQSTSRSRLYPEKSRMNPEIESWLLLTIQNGRTK